MDVLVTGATGFVGAYLCRRLLEDGHRVTALRRPASDPAILSGLDLVHVIGDVTDGESVKRAVRDREAVIHAAAQLGHSPRHMHIQDKVNVEGTRNIVAACRENGVRRLVHVSSVAAVGIPPDRNHPADERFPFNLERSGLSYHLSKKHAEDEVLYGVRRGLDAVIANPSWIWGPHRQGFRGSDVPGKVARRRIVPYFAGGGNVVHVRDVVDGILEVLTRGRTGERYILGGENVTWREAFEIAAEVLRLKRIFVPVPSFVTGTAAVMLGTLDALTGGRLGIGSAARYFASPFLFYDSSKARTELDYRARPYRQIVEEYSRYRAPTSGASPDAA